MTTATKPPLVIPPLSSTDPSSASITRAARGHNDSDWTVAKGEFNARLEDILTQWDDLDASPYTTQISSFPAPPHTVQRLAELLEDPMTWYTSPQKFIRALVRVLSVTSTTIDYSEDQESAHVLHDDSLLVPIPWLNEDSIDGPALEPIPASSYPSAANTSTSTTTTTTTTGNGVRVISNGRIEGHFEDEGSSSGSAGISAPGSGSAPMDAADYGPQSEDVKEAIAMNGTGVGNATVHSHAPVRAGNNGPIDEMDTTP